MRPRALTILSVVSALTLVVVALLISPRPPRIAPTLVLPLLGGGKLEIGRAQRAPILLVFWSVTCTPCLKQIPIVVRAWRTLHPLGVDVVAVDLEADPVSVVRQFARTALPYPVALDPEGRAAAAFHLRSMPRAVLIGPGGRILFDRTGAFRVFTLRRDILKWRAQHTPATGAHHALD
ncbi:MAG: TlpA family protein disulfide reductase [Acidiferrobacteraceae bacterium]